jgi:putative oxidoreductase
MSESKLRSFEPYARSVLRIVAGYMVMALGTHGAFGVPGPPKPQTPEAVLGAVLGRGVILEAVGGALMILGLLTVPAALVLCVHMAIIYLTMFASKGSPLLPFRNGGPFPVYFFFAFLFLFIAGPGPWSLDNAIAGIRHKKDKNV